METINIDMDSKKKENKIAVSLDTINKYMPGPHHFYIQALTPTKDKSKEFTEQPKDLSKIKNKDKSQIEGMAQFPKTGSSIMLEVPKEVARRFQTKFIPPGTRFVCNFDGGDSTRLKIIGRDFIEEQGGYNSEKLSTEGNLQYVWKGNNSNG